MTVLYPHKQRKAYVTYANSSKLFRTDVILQPRRSGSFIFLSGIFRNPLEYYEFISKPLSSGIYKIRIDSVDNLDNKNIGVETISVVSTFPLPPRNLIGSVVGNTVTLSWDHPVSGEPDNYRIYGNGGSGDLINRDIVLAEISGSLTTYDLTVADGDWRFVVESVVL